MSTNDMTADALEVATEACSLLARVFPRDFSSGGPKRQALVVHQLIEFMEGQAMLSVRQPGRAMRIPVGH